MATELRLEQPKGDCLLCGCRPISEDEKRRTLPMVHAVGIDVNWGEDVDICMSCAGVIADLLGRPSKERVEDLQTSHDKLLAEHEELTETYEGMKQRVEKILAGRKAQREQTKGA